MSTHLIGQRLTQLRQELAGPTASKPHQLATSPKKTLGIGEANGEYVR